MKGKKYVIIQLVLAIYIVPAGLILASNLLLQSTEYWNYRHVPWCPAKGFKKKKKSINLCPGIAMHTCHFRI